MAQEEKADKGKEIVYKLLVEVFESSILEADLTDAICNLTEFYNSFSTQGFESSFDDILMLILSDSKRTTDVQKMFKFISEFVVVLDNKYKSEHSKNNKEKPVQEDDEDLLHPFLQQLFATLESWSKASFYVIRFRACQLLYMILTNILDNGVGEIDVHAYEKIASLIQARRKDISANVRAHAVMLAKFFQDPTDHNDPVIAGLCWQLEADPNARVRQNILEIIAACEETIIPITRRFLYDKNAQVRNSALLHICHRISPRSYTTYHRILILNKCFYDSSASVRRNAEQKLIPIWFRAYGDKLCLFFKNLRLGNDCLDKLPFTRDLLHMLFKLVKISQILEEIDLDTETALPKSLNGEIVFIWRHFYAMASQQEKLRKYIPEPENLIQFMIKCFKESTFDGNLAYTYNELISFAMDIIDIIGEEKCEKFPPVAIDIMRNPFVPREVIPYAVAFYCEYATKETKEIHADLLEVVNELLKFIDISFGEEQKKFILRSLGIFSEILAQESICGSMELIAVKDELILSNFDSDDEDIKLEALRALSLYCLIDYEEAKQFWPFIEKALYQSSNIESKQKILKGAFDILNCYGSRLFGDHIDEAIDQFEETLDKLLTHVKEFEVEVDLILKGMFKLYLNHHTYNPALLARLIILMFEPEKTHVAKTNISNFHQSYGESKEEAECLTKSYLTIINMLFDSHKNNPYHKLSIKNVATQLLEYAKMYEENKNFELEDKFRDLLVLKLTRKFLKKPWRFSAFELQDVCEHIIPRDIDKLQKLKSNVKLIIESLQSAIFQQKNPFSKKSAKFFTNYLKKIQTAIDTGSDEDCDHSPQGRHYSTGSSFLTKVPMEKVSPELFVDNKEVSF